MEHGNGKHWKTLWMEFWLSNISINCGIVLSGLITEESKMIKDGVLMFVGVMIDCRKVKGEVLWSLLGPHPVPGCFGFSTQGSPPRTGSYSGSPKAKIFLHPVPMCLAQKVVFPGRCSNHQMGHTFSICGLCMPMLHSIQWWVPIQEFWGQIHYPLISTASRQARPHHRMRPQKFRGFLGGDQRPKDRCKCSDIFLHRSCHPSSGLVKNQSFKEWNPFAVDLCL